MSTNQNYEQLFSRENWPLWLLVHHYLTPNMLLSLLNTIVIDITEEQKNIEDLFIIYEEFTSTNLEDIPVRPIQLGQDERLEANLQNMIRSIFWNGDSFDIFNISRVEVGEKQNLKLKVAAVVLSVSASDFNHKNTLSNFFDSEFLSAYKCLELIKRFVNLNINERYEEQLFFSLESDGKKYSIILSTLLSKFIGDLFADLDLWEEAKEQYIKVLSLLDQVKQDFSNEVSIWKDQCELSIANSIRILEGGKEAAEYISEKSIRADLYKHPVLGLTGALDSMNYAFELGYDNRNNIPWDLRATYVQANAKGKNLDVTPAFLNWFSGREDNAFRLFWSCIRRQIGNGSDTSVRTNKHWYAKCLLDRNPKEISGKDFEMALQLLIESERYSEKDKFNIRPEVIKSHYNVDVLKRIFVNSNRYTGVKIKRLNTLMNIYKLSYEFIENEGVKKCIWEQTIEVALNFDSSFRSEINAGGVALEAILTYVKLDSGLIFPFTDKIVEILSLNLNKKVHWTGLSLPIEIAIECISNFNELQLGTVVEEILNLLENKVSPENQIWPVVRPAMRLLTSKEVKEWSLAMNKEAGRIVNQILHYGLKDKSFTNDVLYNLIHWDAQVLQDGDLKERLKPVIISLLRDSESFNSTACVRSIRSLLLASSFLSEDQFHDVINRINHVLSLVKENKRAPVAFTDMYTAILILIEKYSIKYIPDEKNNEWFRDKKQEILDNLLAVWRVSKEKSTVFEIFAIPQKGYPDETLIYNWAITTLRIARVCKREVEALGALDNASENVDLSAAILKARIAENLYSVEKEQVEDLEYALTRIQSSSDFYKYLSYVLATISSLSKNEGTIIIKQLLNKVLFYGPNIQDLSLIHI